jgi:hypothetical protein
MPLVCLSDSKRVDDGLWRSFDAAEVIGKAPLAAQFVTPQNMVYHRNKTPERALGGDGEN